MQENNVQSVPTPKNVLIRMQIARLGKIAFNLQFIAVALMAASVLSFLSIVVYAAIVMVAVICTLGLIFVAYPSFADGLTGSGEALTSIFNMLAASWTYTAPTALALAGVSIICLCFDYREKHVARISISAVIAAIAVIVLIIKLVGGAA
ncbi:MAG: hypothetical protein K2O44_05500 [Clostridia bacterium]|nr:hypothetical protein [Clostridia bacterium]